MSIISTSTVIKSIATRGSRSSVRSSSVLRCSTARSPSLIYSRLLHNRSSTTKMEAISTSNSAAPAAPYSQAIKANGQIWVSGQVHADKDGKLVQGSITERTRQCCENVKSILEAGGSSMDKIVRVGVFLVDMKDFAEMNEEYKKWFPHKPARACVAVHQLPLGCTVEIEAIALA